MIPASSLRSTVRALGLAGRPVCVHASLRSFGVPVDGGAGGLVRAMLTEGCTVLVPAFSWGFAVPPPDDPALCPARNGWDYDAFAGPTSGIGRVYTPDTREIDTGMGAVPAAVVATTGRARGDHPLCSFAAVGPLAGELVRGQAPHDVYAPLERLAGADGAVLLVGVGLERMTILHLAEKRAERTLFRRWANGTDGSPVPVEVGGCSDGFVNFAPVLAPLGQEVRIVESRWRALPAADVLTRGAAAIRARPGITACPAPDCVRCRDALPGGPIG